MAYFSLLYETEQQETDAHVKAKQHVYCNVSNKKEPKYTYVGARMVVLEEPDSEERSIPYFSKDLCIDQILHKIFPNGMSDKFVDFFYGIPLEPTLIKYRQALFLDLHQELIMSAVRTYWTTVVNVKKLWDQSKDTTIFVQKNKYILDATVLYFHAMNELVSSLDGKVQSLSLQNFIVNLKQSMENHSDIIQHGCRIKQDLDQIYCTLLITNSVVEVKWEKGELDYSKHIQDSFGISTTQNNIHIFQQTDMTSFEIKLLELCEKQYPDFFEQCNTFSTNNPCVIDEFQLKLQDELNLLLSCISILEDLKLKGFPITIPKINSNSDYDLNMMDVYDMLLGLNTDENSSVTCNSFQLQKGEKGAWITGANQGGKTTFARAVGQVIYFAMLGLPVPGTSCTLPLYQGLYTHFQAEENASVSNGKLKEELLRIKELDRLAPNHSFFILNELFSSTTALDAYDMSMLFVKHLHQKEGTVLCVTHVPSLASNCEEMVSLVATLETEQNNKRLYGMHKQKASISARAIDIADKYQLRKEQIKERIIHGESLIK